jgi:hypothetical protein
MEPDFFPTPPEKTPVIYAYAEQHNDQTAGLLKVGYTTRNVRERVAEQFVLTPGEPYTIMLVESAVRSDGTTFTDKAVHQILRRDGFENPAGEWFRAGVDDIRAAILELKTGASAEKGRVADFVMRPEQAAAVEKTAKYFHDNEYAKTHKTPHFLWNC